MDKDYILLILSQIRLDFANVKCCYIYNSNSKEHIMRPCGNLRQSSAESIATYVQQISARGRTPIFFNEDKLTLAVNHFISGIASVIA